MFWECINLWKADCFWILVDAKFLKLESFVDALEISVLYKEFKVESLDVVFLDTDLEGGVYGISCLIGRLDGDGDGGNSDS